MRVAFVGKGGSGKTTVSSLFCAYAQEQGRTVLAIDADINQQLAWVLGVPTETAQRLPAMGNRLPEIKDYVRGTNPRIPSAADMLKTTPPGSGSRFIHVREADPFLQTFGYRHENIHLLVTGGFEEQDLGVKCYHAKTGAVELVLNHLLDTENDIVIVDMTAGADAFASGLFTKFDLTLVVVEPTLASIDVYRQYKLYASTFNVPVAAIGNKVLDTEEERFLRTHLSDDLITIIPYSQAVKKRDRGEPSKDALEPAVHAALKIVENHLRNNTRNWDRLYRYAVDFHERNAKSWGNTHVGKDVSNQIDPTFSASDLIRACS